MAEAIELEELANRFNKVGGVLPDNTRLLSLYHESVWSPATPPEWRKLVISMSEDESRLLFSGVISFLRWTDINTVGELRKTSLEDMLKLRNVGRKTASLVFNTFKAIPEHPVP